MDATLVETNKANVLWCYKGFKSYQPLNRYIAKRQSFEEQQTLPGMENPQLSLPFPTMRIDSKRYKVFGIVTNIKETKMNGENMLLTEYENIESVFIIVKFGNDRIEIDSYLENEFLDKKGHIGLNVAKSVIEYPVHLLFVSSIGEISFHLLKNNYVAILSLHAIAVLRFFTGLKILFHVSLFITIYNYYSIF